MSDAAATLDIPAWDRLRTAVRAKQRGERLTYKGLGERLHPPLSEKATRNALCRQTAPPATVVARFENWLARRGVSQPAPVAAPQPPLEDPCEGLAKALRRKLHCAALTRTTVAQVAGVDVEDLDAALLGEPIASDAMAKLTAWAG